MAFPSSVPCFEHSDGPPVPYAGENVVLLSNHQTEADPSAFTALLDPLDDGACFCFRV